MNLGKILKTAAREVTKRPGLALIVLGVVAPKAAAKVAATVAKVKAAREL